MSGRSRSTKGTTSARPGESVRWKRPNRSLTPARACGTIRTGRATTSRTKAATAAKTIKAIMRISCSTKDERRGALDLCDLDVLSGMQCLAVEEWTGRPLFAADLHAAAGAVDLLEHDCLLAHEGGGSGGRVKIGGEE